MKIMLRLLFKYLFKIKIAGIEKLEFSGLTLRNLTVFSVNTPLFNREGTVGKFLPGIEWQIESVNGIESGGNLLVRAPNIMDGYLFYQKGFVPVTNWYDCGDIVSMDEDNFITIKSRIKRFAKISGEMLSLDVVESIASECFEINYNAAISVQDAKKGEKITLFTTSKAANRQVFRDYLIKAGQSKLLLPSDIIILDKLPYLSNGKTDYVSLHSYIREDKVE